jgi:hypothetical protein
VNASTSITTSPTSPPQHKHQPTPKHKRRENVHSFAFIKKSEFQYKKASFNGSGAVHSFFTHGIFQLNK